MRFRLPSVLIPALALATGFLRADKRAMTEADGEISRGALLRRQPFSSGRKPAETAGAGAPEFRGYLESETDTEVSLKDPVTGRSVWVRLRDPGAAYFVESFDPAGNSLVLRINGASSVIRLRKEASVESRPPGWENRSTMPEHIRADGKVWTEPAPGEGRHPDDPGNAD